MRIHSIETLGALDGPGIRTVIFFQGCPMRCVYCHNADMFDCKGGSEMSANQLVEFCKRYKNYYGKNGGVTLCGGEPLKQGGAVVELISKLKAQNIHTALDTSGCIFHKGALNAADLVILDIKHTDPEKYREITGQKIDNLLKTLEFLKSSNKKFYVRQVIVEGLTDDPNQIRALKEMAKGAEKIELLPYHTLGAEKWQKIGLEYALKNAAPPSKALMDKLNKILNE